VQLLAVAAKMASFQPVRAFAFHIGNHYGQHSLMHIFLCTSIPLSGKT